MTVSQQLGLKNVSEQRQGECVFASKLAARAGSLAATPPHSMSPSSAIDRAKLEAMRK